MIIAAMLAAVSACAHHIDPQVTQYNGDSVTVATSQKFKRRWALTAAEAEAGRVCRRGQGKRAEHASTEADHGARQNLDLFLCLN